MLQFPTVHGNQEALAAQRAWLARIGPELGLVVRDRQTMTEIDLPGPEGAPVLGLVVHGDLQPVNASEWTVPPFAATFKDGAVWGRGAADDKGPLVQALLAMAALRSSGLARTYTVRLLVGTDEEGGASDLEEYKKRHPLPDVSLVLDSDFPVVIGEKAWAEWIVTADERAGPSSRTGGGGGPRGGDGGEHRPGPRDADPSLAIGHAGLGPLARARARGARCRRRRRWRSRARAAERLVVAHGRAAHAGVGLVRGRNALVALAVAVHGRLPPCAAADLLEYTRVAGADTRGRGLGLTLDDPLWGGVDTNFGEVKRGEDGRLALHVNLRSPPALWGEALKARVDANAMAFAAKTGARFQTGGQFGFEPFVVPASAPLVVRLLEAYARGTGAPGKGVVSAGGTYARRMTNAVAFGMWFREDGVYPGHNSDERMLDPLARARDARPRRGAGGPGDRSQDRAPARAGSHRRPAEARPAPSRLAGPRGLLGGVKHLEVSDTSSSESSGDVAYDVAGPGHTRARAAGLRVQRRATAHSQVSFVRAFTSAPHLMQVRTPLWLPSNSRQGRSR